MKSPNERMSEHHWNITRVGDIKAVKIWDNTNYAEAYQKLWT